MTMMPLAAPYDEIHIHDIDVDTEIGCLDEERGKTQRLRINLVVYCDTRRCGETDNIEDTVDYRLLSDRVVSVAASSHYRTIERLASRLAEVCVMEFRTPQVRVQIDKPDAPRLAARYPSLVIVRTHHDYDNVEEL